MPTSVRSEHDAGWAVRRHRHRTCERKSRRPLCCLRALHPDRRRSPRGGHFDGRQHPRGVAQIIEFAFDYALKNGRKKVTVVHKANVLKALTGVFLEVGHEVAKKYEGKVKMDDRIVDARRCSLLWILGNST